MCGICGFTGPSRPTLIAAMAAALEHRGPDEDGLYAGDGVTLAMRRLALVDREGGRQPVFNEDDSLALVFNGEIYDHRAQRDGLRRRGHALRSDHSDTEVVVHLYEEHGIAWPEAAGVDGMFAAALWDGPRRTLVLWRDRLGKKPLYWARIGRHIAFASEIKALLLHPQVSRALNHPALGDYFSLKHIPAPATAYAGISQLPPGHALVWRDGEVGLHPYWQPSFGPADPVPDEDEAATRLLALLDRAVELRMACDAPLGAYLSGGVDSSAVAALAAGKMDRPLNTFCIGYDDEVDDPQMAGKAQDMAFARDMARRLGSHHTETVIGSARFVQALPAIVAAFDEPFSGAVSTYFVSAAMHPTLKAALSGDGADELFGSYLTHRLAQPMAHYLRLGRPESDEAGLLAPFAPSFLAGLASPDPARWRLGLAVWPDEAKAALFTPAFRDAAGAGGTLTHHRRVLAGATATTPLAAVLEHDLRDLLPNQVLAFVDRLSMAHSMEVRSPFLAAPLVEFALGLPDALKISGGLTKRVLRRALAGILPAEVLSRPKEGFVQPVYAWMRGPLAGWVAETLAPGRVEPFGFLRPDAVARTVEALARGEDGAAARVWNLICFQLWCEHALGGGMA